MRSTPQYSTLFTCLYDESVPIGDLGRGTHYSIFRSVEPRDVVGSPLHTPEVHDFGVIWDEDHDLRIVPVIEQIYMGGLLSPVQFIGERKGALTVIVAAKFWSYNSEEDFDAYKMALFHKMRGTILGDVWSLEVGMFDRNPGSPTQTNLKGLIADDEIRSSIYVRNIDSLWKLGTKPFQPERPRLSA
jgi:hypothetical protein